jgi:hypothetical protein
METPPAYRIHPAVGIARLGDSPDEFYIAPDQPAAKPTDCDVRGNPKLSPDGTAELPVIHFKDAQGRIKRQAARFQIFAYDDEHPAGRPLRLGDRIEGGGNNGTLVDIIWQVYPANKKAVWYEFRGLAGETGYEPGHPRRNADVTEPNARQALIIDPGPQIVNMTDRRRAEFSRDGNPGYAVTFPPKGLWPHDIDTLGTAMTDDVGRLLVLGGHGRSGSYKTGLGQPRIDNYANTDGWFDDTSDGPVMARLVMFSEEVQQLRYVDVEYPAWVASAYPRYAPELLDMVTMEEVVEDLFIRQFAYRPDLYGTAGTFGTPQRIDGRDQGALAFWRNGRLEWNAEYRPWFWRDIWPILFRPNEFNWVCNILLQSNMPHDQSRRGTFDPTRLAEPPLVAPGALRRREDLALAAHADGVQATEALEPALLRRERDIPTTIGKLDALLKGLAAAFKRFVTAVAPAAKAEAPDAYLRRWYRIFADNRERPSAAYEAAKQALDDEVDRLIVPAEAKLRLTARREQDKAAKALDPDERLVDAVDRVLLEFRSGRLLAEAYARATVAATTDPFGPMRTYLYEVLRRPGEENVFQLGDNPTTRTYHMPLMPLLAGDNPKYNDVPSKFLRLTDTQLYLLRQWAEGKFINEVMAGFVPRDSINPWQPYPRGPVLTGRELDRGVLSNALGGAFFPGGEIGWIMRNTAVWYEPYRLKADQDFYVFRETAAQTNAIKLSPFSYVSYAGNDLSQDSDYATGLQPGDLTKMMALPWQADFNECTTQDIDVTYEAWNLIDPDNPNDPVMKREQKVWETMWWPAHRPLQVAELVDDGAGGLTTTPPLNWSRGVPQTNAGDLKMVTAWTQLSFVVINPTLPPDVLNSPQLGKPRYVGIERGKETP